MKRIISVLLIFLIMFSSAVCSAEYIPSKPVKSLLLMEASSGKILYEQNSHESLPPASVTKIITMLLICEAVDSGKISLDTKITVSERAKSMGGSTIFLETNEVMTLNDLLKGIAVASANDACVAVAEHMCGSVEAFVALMNARAKELGMKDTNFINCNGLDADNHYTSAYDIAIMSRELVEKHPAIYDYTTIWMENITHETKQGSSLFTLSSTNKLLKQYPYTTGLKTGSTSKAKFCVSATARKDNLDMIAVIMGAEDGRCVLMRQKHY